MALIIIIILAILVGGFLFIRRGKKRRDNTSNRYRHYQVKRPEKQPKMRRNRYHRTTTRREPELAAPPLLSSVVDELPEPKPEERKIKVKPPKAPKVKKPKKIEVMDSAEFSDDPDVVLGLKESPSLSREKPIPTNAQITLKVPQPEPPLVVFHIMAEANKPFNGYELLQALLSVGMRYGQHHIFHRHQEKTGRGPILFSLASLAKPGTFDLPKMGGFSTPGLSLFFASEDVDDPIGVYELMLQTAGQLVEDLGGHVLDNERQMLTPASVVAQRRLLHEYVEGKNSVDLFEE